MVKIAMFFSFAFSGVVFYDGRLTSPVRQFYFGKSCSIAVLSKD